MAIKRSYNTNFAQIEDVSLQRHSGPNERSGFDCERIVAHKRRIFSTPLGEFQFSRCSSHCVDAKRAMEKLTTQAGKEFEQLPAKDVVKTVSNAANLDISVITLKELEQYSSNQ